MKLTTLAAAALALAFGTAAAAQTPNHVYDLDGSTADTLGGPALTRQGVTTQGASGVSFSNTLSTPHSGLVLPGVATAFTSGDVYSVELYFSFGNVTGYNRVLNSGSHDDNGAYVYNSLADYFINTAGRDASGGPVLSPNQLIHYVLTRDATATDLYINGSQAVVRAGDVTSARLIDDLRFFIDDSTEESGGFVDFIRTYDSVLTDAQVARLYNNGTPLPSSALIGTSGAVPEPASWGLMILGLGAVGAAMRRRAARLAAA